MADDWKGNCDDDFNWQEWRAETTTKLSIMKVSIRN